MADLIPTWIDGELTSLDKLTVHRLGLPHKAVSVFLMAGERTLLQRRAGGKYHTPGLWANACCTHPRWAEPPLACARRRLGQELGVTGVAPRHRGRIAYRAEVGGGLVEDEVVDVFVADVAPDLRLDLDPAEVSQTRWTTLPDLADEIDEAPDRFTPWLRIYLRDHADTIFDAPADRSAAAR